MPALSGQGSVWNAFDMIYPVRYGSQWGTNVVTPETKIFKDISRGTLPAMSGLIRDSPNSDHPNSKPDTGPSWVASVVNATAIPSTYSRAYFEHQKPSYKPVDTE